jgi:vancomycin aglycone glucosyltransferase
MRALLSTIGSRGDVQPVVALGLALRRIGHDVRLCVPPDFCAGIEGLGMPAVPIGPSVRGTGRVSPSLVPTAEQRRQMMEGTVSTQFETIARAAEGCDVIVGATTLQIGAPSVAEHLGIPYVFAAYCAAILPSPHHAPPILPSLGDTPVPAMADYGELWTRDAERWNNTWRELINRHRTALDLARIDDAHRYVITDRPWLASDATLGPWPDPTDRSVVQTGAWILNDERPLSRELEAFLEAGDPPVYFGFGSNRAPENLSRVMIDSARALGRRTILLRGWADLSLPDDQPDCLAIDDVNHQLLFEHVAAVVHHGGAGTTTAAGRAGAPQVVIPHHFDQHYWAERVEHLGVGVAHRSFSPTAESLTAALERVLTPATAARARSLAAQTRGDGADVAARLLVS